MRSGQQVKWGEEVSCLVLLRATSVQDSCICGKPNTARPGLSSLVTRKKQLGIVIYDKGERALASV